MGKPETSWPGRLPLAVLAIGLALTLGGFFLARSWVATSERNALEEQAAQTATVMASFGRQVEAILVAGSIIADVTNGDPEAFTMKISERVEGTAVSSISLLERGSSVWAPTATAGSSVPVLLPRFGRVDQRRLDRIAGDGGRIELVKIEHVGDQPVIGFAASAGTNRRLLVYGESVTPLLSRLFFFRLPHGLQFALYIGKVRPGTLIASSTTLLPIEGETVEESLRFGAENAVLVVGGSRLVGGVAAASPWLVLGLGSAAAAAAALLVALVRRREAADEERRVLAAQNAQLRELDRLKDELVATVSHELRTPLTSILGYLELLREDGSRLTSEHRAFIDVIDRNARRLLGLVGDLLFVARLDAGGIELDLAEVDLEELVRECVVAQTPHAEQAGLSLELVSESLEHLTGDRSRLAQLLDNLVSNAIKFTPAGGRVVVRLAREGDRAVLEVEDTGMGVPADEQDRLFDRFFRSSTATAEAIQGTGLGLAISKAIVTAHGGTVVATSEEGVGTTFRVELPLAGAPATTELSAGVLVS